MMRVDQIFIGRVYVLTPWIFVGACCFVLPQIWGPIFFLVFLPLAYQVGRTVSFFTLLLCGQAEALGRWLVIDKYNRMDRKKRHTPDKWVLVKYTENGATYHHISAYWNHRFIESEWLKQSNEIKSASLVDGTFNFQDSHGTLYECKTDRYGASNLCLIYYDEIQKSSEYPGLTCEILTMDAKLIDLFPRRI